MLQNAAKNSQDLGAKLLSHIKQNFSLTQPFHQNQYTSAQFSQRYQIIKEAGKGAFGSVYKALDLQKKNTVDPFDNSQYVAIKKLFYDRRYEQRELSILDEIKKRKLCRNIIELKDRYFQTIEELDQKTKVNCTKEYLFIVTDYLPYTVCDLKVFNVQNQKPAVCLESIKQVMQGLFQGLHDLHSMGITHRDIKLSNILIDNDKNPVTLVKICDLGSSKKLMSNPNDEST